jgi:hypothetical protein
MSAPTAMPLQWRSILLSALVASLLSLALTFAGAWLVPIFFPFECDCPSNDIGSALGCGISCGIAAGIGYALLLGMFYFVAAIVITAILINLWVSQRRFLHSFLAVLLSIPASLFILWLLDLIL